MTPEVFRDIERAVEGFGTAVSNDLAYVGNSLNGLASALYYPTLAGLTVWGIYTGYHALRERKRDETWDPAPQSLRQQWERPEVTNRYGKFGLGPVLLPVPFYNDPKRWVEVNKTYKQFLPDEMGGIFDNVTYTNALVGALTRAYKEDPLGGLHALRQIKLARNKARWGVYYDIPSKIKNWTLDQSERYYDEYLQGLGKTTPRVLHQRAAYLQALKDQMNRIEEAGRAKAEGQTGHPTLKRAGELATYGIPKGLGEALFGKLEEGRQREPAAA